MDQGMEDDDKSRLYAFDTATGDQVWATVREVGPTWATPIAIEAGGRQQIVTVAVPWLIAYAAETGKELWSADIMDGEIAPPECHTGIEGKKNTLPLVNPAMCAAGNAQD